MCSIYIVYIQRFIPSPKNGRVMHPPYMWIFSSISSNGEWIWSIWEVLRPYPVSKRCQQRRYTFLRGHLNFGHPDLPETYIWHPTPCHVLQCASKVVACLTTYHAYVVDMCCFHARGDEVSEVLYGSWVVGSCMGGGFLYGWSLRHTHEPPIRCNVTEGVQRLYGVF